MTISDHLARAAATAPQPEAQRRLGTATLIIDADAMFAELLAGYLAVRHDLRIVATSSMLAEAAKASADHRPGLVILNPALPDGSGLGLVETLTAANPAVKVLVIGSAMTLMGIRRGPIPPAVGAVVEKSAGLSRLSREIARLQLDADHSGCGKDIAIILSRRELDVFTQIGHGLTNTEIAARLGISPQTAETHRKSITKKLAATGPRLIRLAVLHVSGITPQSQA